MVERAQDGIGYTFHLLLIIFNQHTNELVGKRDCNAHAAYFSTSVMHFSLT